MGFFGRTSETSGCARLGVLAMAVTIALSCHYFDEEDSGSSFLSPSQFEGTWQGTLRLASTGDLQDLVLAFDANSEIASVTIDGADQGLTGTVAFSDPNPLEEFARFYDFELVDGSGATQAVGSFYIDDRFQHGLFIYSNGDFAVLENSVAGRPAGGFGSDAIAEKRTLTRVLGVYIEWLVTSEIDEVGDWVIATDAQGGGGEIPYMGMIGGDVVRLDSGQSNEKTLENGDPIAGNFTNFDPMGSWEGLDAPGDSKPLYAIISFDGSFAGTMECDPNGFPECTFGLWSFDDCRADDYPECAFNL
jgi:hypothetical protein